MSNVKVIAIDFDGTLCTNAWPGIGKPREGIIAMAKYEKKNGAKLILNTMREGSYLTDALMWCEEQDLVFDAVNDNLPEWIDDYGNNPRKIGATEYWDDRSRDINFLDAIGTIMDGKAYEEDTDEF